MPVWECGIEGCHKTFENVESAIVHQTNAHERRECKVCGSVVPDGYLAIRHAFEEHTRAEYVRAYEANAEDVREREAVKELVEEEADMDEVVTRLNESGGGVASRS